MNYETILTERKRHVGVLTLNRPDDGNRETVQMHEEVLEAMETFNKDKNIRAVIITGAGKDFCHGASYKRFDDVNPFELMDVYQEVEIWRTKMMDFPKPTIAAVNGMAQASGAHIAYNCDITIMEEDAVIAANAVDAGIPCMKSLQKITRMIGHKKALQMVMTGEFWSAHEAERFGLINYIAPKGKLMEFAMEKANIISSKNPIGMRFLKDTIRITRDMGIRDTGEFSNTLIPMLMLAGDTKEAMDALVEGREPHFTNRDIIYKPWAYVKNKEKAKRSKDGVLCA